MPTWGPQPPMPQPPLQPSVQQQSQRWTFGQVAATAHTTMNDPVPTALTPQRSSHVARRSQIPTPGRGWSPSACTQSVPQEQMPPADVQPASFEPRALFEDAHIPVVNARNGIEANRSTPRRAEPQLQSCALQCVAPAVWCDDDLTWDIDPQMHPMVRDCEKTYVRGCLEMVAQHVQHAGGVSKYTSSDCTSNLEPQDKVRILFERLLKENCRNGSEEVFVDKGSTLSFGEKKVMKLDLKCEDFESRVSVCWNWDILLEPIN